MASPADVNLVCNSGAGEVETDITGTGVDFITADNCLNTSGNRTTNPITIPAAGFAYSYEKWLKFELGTTEPDTQVTNFKFWGAGTEPEAGVVLDYYQTTSTYATPALATTNTAYTAVSTATSGAKASITGTLNTQGEQTDYLVMMLEVSTGASQGNMAQQTYNYSYDEN
jgi:hypothetical protein